MTKTPGVTVKSLEKFAGKEWMWLKPSKGDRTWKLIADGETLATLRREKRFGTLWTADAGGKRWTLKRVGFFRVRVTVRPEGFEIDEAEFHPRWSGGGELTMSDGKRFAWAPRSFWRQEWTFSDGEIEVLRYRCGFTMSKGRVSFASQAARRRELPLLVALGWYLILLMAEDSGAGAAAAGAAAAG